MTSQERRPQCNICGELVPLSGFTAHLESHKWQCLCGTKNVDHVINCVKCQYNRDYVRRMREEESDRRTKLQLIVDSSKDKGIRESLWSWKLQHLLVLII